MRAPSRALLQHLAARTATPASPLTWSLSSARSASRNGCAALVRPPSSPAAHAPSRRPHRPNGARAAGRLSSPWNVCARARQGPFQRPDGPLAQTAYSSTLQWPHGTQRRRYTTDVDVETGAAASPESMTAQERAVWEKVQKALQPEKLVVQDISGGCGSMFALEIEAAAFRGMGVVAMHRAVNALLQDEIRGWHGLRLVTRAPPL